MSAGPAAAVAHLPGRWIEFHGLGRSNVLRLCEPLHLENDRRARFAKTPGDPAKPPAGHRRHRHPRCYSRRPTTPGSITSAGNDQGIGNMQSSSGDRWHLRHGAVHRSALASAGASGSHVKGIAGKIHAIRFLARSRVIECVCEYFVGMDLGELCEIPFGFSGSESSSSLGFRGELANFVIEVCRHTCQQRRVCRSRWMILSVASRRGALFTQ